jgi:aryl-alcohol dehydrogenase-like predicted oxidoreductase
VLRTSIAAINHALDLCINWVDTAAVYGLGRAEEIVARALEGRSERPYIFTKCGRVWNERGEISGSLKAQSIRRECENSLRRLRVDVIDLYQVHWPDPERDIEKDILPFCQEHNIGVIVYSPMASGLLTGTMTRERIERLPEDDWRKRDPEQVDGNIPAAEFRLTDSEAARIEEFLK